MKTPLSEDDLFQAVVRLAEPDRTAFLERQCGENHALRARLERLLAAYEHPAPMLADQPAPAHATM